MFGFLPAARFTSLYELPELDPWLVPGIIPVDSVVILASSPKVGKTAFATALARAVATGSEFLGQKVKQKPILWCAHEENPRERVLLQQGLTEEDPFYIAYSDTLPALDDPQGEFRKDRYGRYDDRITPYVFQEAVEKGAGLIVIDSLHAAIKAGDLAHNSFARRTMEKLVGWSFRMHCSVLVLHHLTKSASRGYHPERFADSGQILASANAHFFMGRHPSPGKDKALRFTLHGQGRYPEPIRTLEIESPNLREYRLLERSTERKPSQAERLVQYFESRGQATIAEAATDLQMSPTSTTTTVCKLVRNGQLAYLGKEQKARIVVPVTN